MNNSRRKMLQEIMDRLTEIRDNLDAVKEEEEEYRDNIPENLQGSERYEKTEAACDSLIESVDYIDEVIQGIETAME